MAHLVGRATAAADPDVRVRVGPVRGGVVVPRRHLHQRTLRQQRRRGVGVDVAVVPVEVEVARVAQELTAAVWQNRLQRHRRAPQMHVRLEALDPGAALQREETLGHGEAVGRDVHLAGAHQMQHLTMRGRLVPRIEVDTELDVVGDLLTRRRVVDVPLDLGPRHHQLAAVRTHDLALLADRPLHEGAGAPGPVHSADVVGLVGLPEQLVGLVLNESGDRVVDDPATRDRRRPGLDGARPALLGQPGRHPRLPPGVARLGRHRVRGRLDDQVGRTVELLREVPLGLVRPVNRRRHVLGVAPWRTAVDPADDRVDLCVGQRAIVLELRDADRGVDVPGWHLLGGHSILDRPGPGPRFLVSHQGHRRDRAGPMARFALGLEDRGNVLREGRDGLSFGGGRCRRHHDRDREQENTEGPDTGALHRHPPFALRVSPSRL